MLESYLPPGFKWRQLWLAELGNNSASIPSSANGGAKMSTFTGAKQGTTTDGLRFTGAATSNMVTAADAVLNNKAKFAIFLRFKFDVTFAAGTATQYIATKRLAADDYLDLYFDTANGKLTFAQGNRALGVQFTLTSTTVSWTANTWYTVIASLSDTGPAQRLLVNGVAEDTDTQVAINTSNGGDLVIGNSTDGGADGFIGVISAVAVFTDDLTTTEEANLNRGIFPTDAVNCYLLETGRGTTGIDRGSGADNAAIDAACTWEYSAVRQPAISFDGINDIIDTGAANVSIGGSTSLVVIVKCKNTLHTDIGNLYLAEMRISGTYEMRLQHATGANGIVGGIFTAGGNLTVSYTATASIDDYRIYILTYSAAGTANLMVNGVWNTTVTTGSVMPATLIRCYFGGSSFGHSYSVDRKLLIGLVEGALSREQCLQLSRRLNTRYGLGLTI